MFNTSKIDDLVQRAYFKPEKYKIVTFIHVNTSLGHNMADALPLVDPGGEVNRSGYRHIHFPYILHSYYNCDSKGLLGILL